MKWGENQLSRVTIEQRERDATWLLKETKIDYSVQTAFNEHQFIIKQPIIVKVGAILSNETPNNLIMQNIDFLLHNSFLHPV